QRHGMMVISSTIVRRGPLVSIRKPLSALAFDGNETFLGEFNGLGAAGDWVNIPSLDSTPVRYVRCCADWIARDAASWFCPLVRWPIPLPAPVEARPTAAPTRSGGFELAPVGDATTGSGLTPVDGQSALGSEESRHTSRLLAAPCRSVAFGER